MERFIASVKKYECLWKIDDENYMNTKVKNEAWAKVMKECQMKDVCEARNNWKNLRDGYRQALKRKRNTKERRWNWKYEYLMGFLTPYIKFTPQNISNSSKEVEQPVFLKTELSEPEIDTSPQLEEAQIAIKEVQNQSNGSERKLVQTARKKFKFKTSYSPSVRRPLRGQVLNKNVTKAKSPLHSFFMSMFEEVNKLPPQLQVQIQRKLFDLVINAKEEVISSAGSEGNDTQYNNIT